MAHSSVDLKRQLLFAAVECSGGDTSEAFTFEELLVKAWGQDRHSWGLRGFEAIHPDSERIHRELDSRGKNSKGLVELGWLEKVRPRVYRMTLKGLAEVGRAKPEHRVVREKIRRQSEDEISRIIEHPSFRMWLSDQSRPRKFREAGAFWNVAPGTPPEVIRRRIQQVDSVLDSAQELLADAGLEGLGSGRGTLLFERVDIERSREFQDALKVRFAADLKALGVENLAPATGHADAKEAVRVRRG
jgi:hypothetical protein